MGWFENILVKGRRHPGGGSRLRPWLAAAGVVVVALSTLAVVGYRLDQSRSDRLLPGMRVMGVDVGSMTRAEASAAVRRRLDDLTNQSLPFAAGGESLTITLGELGTSGAVDAAIEQAFADVSLVSPWRRVWRRHRDEPTKVDVAVELSPDPQAVSAMAARMAKDLEKAPVDARLELVDGKLGLDPGAPGRHLDAAQAATIIEATAQAALGGQAPFSPVPLPTTAPAAAVTVDAFPVAIVVRIDEQKLYYYSKGQLAHEFYVASGLAGYDTPTGDFQVVEKLFYPSWINPAPTTWGKDMPAEIPPGPGNPLGTHALGIDSPGIYMHETLGGVGYQASHGCMRMRPDDIQTFYDEVPYGAPVFILDGPSTYRPHVGPLTGDRPPPGADSPRAASI